MAPIQLPVAHVAFAIDAGYLPWCSVAALSCVERSTDVLVHVHLLHAGDLTGHPGAASLVALLERTGATVSMHEVVDERVEALPALDRFGRVVWLRFLLPEVLPDVARVLYLDADTLAATSIAELLSCDLAGAPIGAVGNVVEPSQRERLHRLGLDGTAGSLNSGVLLMDLDQMRREQSTTVLLDTARARADELLWPDQDTLNLVFRDRWHHLHPRWNAQNSMWEWRELALQAFEEADLADAIGSPGIVHFEGPGVCKPWHALCAHPWRRQFWATLARTPWAHTRPEDLTLATRLIRLLPLAPQRRLYVRLLARRRRRRDRLSAELVAAGGDR